MKTSGMPSSLRNQLWNWGKIILAAALLIVVVNKINRDEWKTMWENISYLWFFLSVVLFFFMLFVKTWQYYVLTGRAGTYWDMLGIMIRQNAVANFIATGAGIASYMAMMKAEQKVTLTRSGVAFLIIKFGDLLAIAAYLAFASWRIWPRIVSLHTITLALLAVMLLGLLVFVMTVIWRDRFVDVVSWICQRLGLLRFSVVQRGITALQSLTGEDGGLITSLIYEGVVLSGVYMSIGMISSYAGLQMFGVRLDLWAVIYVTSLMRLVSFVPVQVMGGLGVAEVTLVYLYGQFGVDAAQMATVALGLRGWLYLMNGIALLYIFLEPLWKKLHHQGS